jgi:hypothetical protein
VRGNEIAHKLTRDLTVHFVGPEPTLGISMQNIRKKIKWIDNQHVEESYQYSETGSKDDFGP